MTIQQLNDNGLKQSGFMFTIERYPDIAFPVQSVTVPSISMGTALQQSRQAVIKYPGEKVNYPSLECSFMIDKSLTNYMALFNWLRQNASPEMPTDFATLQALSSVTNPNDYDGGKFSELTLIILNNLNNPVVSFNFHDAFPISIGSFELSTTIDGTEYIHCTCTFDYTYYTVNSC